MMRLGGLPLLLAVGLLTACRAPAPIAPRAEGVQVAEARQRRDGAIRALYEANCLACHGAGVGGGRAPSLFRQSLLASRTDEQLANAIAQGNALAGMPAFGPLLEAAQIGQLITFLRNEAANLAERPPFVPSPDGQILRTVGATVRIEVLARGLDVPWGLAFLPDGRLLVTERAGRLRIIDTATGQSNVVEDLPAVQTGQDAGLFDVAVHPDHARNGWIYICYAETLPGYVPAEVPKVVPAGTRPARPPSMTVVARGRLGPGNRWIDAQVLFRAPAALYGESGVHYGSRLLLDDQGHLFFSLGERGDMAAAQDLASPLGKIHRINDDGSTPADNPFRDHPNVVSSIWSYGHRNPQGLAMDPATGLLWESEHGPTGGDEINLIEPGRNYGWGVVSMGLERGIQAQSAPGMQDPVVHYTPTLAPSGIAFYVGGRYPAWQGQMMVAGLAGQQLRRLLVRGRRVVEQEVLFNQFGRTRAVATGPDGLLYVLLQSPTGSGTGLRLSDPSPGLLIRLQPVETP